LAEDEKSLVGGEGDLAVVVQASAVVDRAVGAFDHPTSWLDDESTCGFRPGHDVGGDPGVGGGMGNGRAGVSVVEPDVGDGRCEAVSVS
jgi:hypothetical protein